MKNFVHSDYVQWETGYQTKQLLDMYTDCAMQSYGD